MAASPHNSAPLPLPTPDSQSLIPPATLSALQADLDLAKSDLARLQIESESELNASNARFLILQAELAQHADLRAQLDSSLAEIKRLKLALESRLGNDSDHSQKIEALQDEKRGLLELVRDKEAEYSEVQAELQSKSEQLQSSTRTIRELESNLLAARDSEMSIRLQAQAARSEATLAISDRDFYSIESERARDELQACRVESHQRTAHLQNELDKLTHSHSNLSTTLTSLRAQHTSLQKLHLDATEKIKHLTDQSIEAEAAFEKEIEAQKRVTELMDKRDKHRGERMEEFEREWNSRRAELDERERVMNETLEQERAHVVELEQKLADTTNALSRLCEADMGEYGSDDHHLTQGDHNSPFGASRMQGTPLSRKQQNGFVLTNGLSPAAAMASKLQKSGKSLTEVYTEKIALEEQLKQVKLENVRLSETMSQILGEIQDRAPLLHQQRIEHDRIERECDELTSQLTRTIEEKEEAERKYQSCQLDLSALQRDHDLSTRQLNDLSLQIRVLTKEIVRRDAGNQFGGIQGEEEDLMQDVAGGGETPSEDDEDVLLANDLITYKNIADLQQKNMKLLLFVRRLTVKLQELEESRMIKTGEEEEEDEDTKHAIDEAHELILQLKTDLQNSQLKTEALSRERDMLRRMLNQSQAAAQSSHEGYSAQSDCNLGDGSQVKFEELRAQFDAYRTEIGADSKRINEDLNQARADLSRTQVLLAKANAQIEYLNERHRNLDQTNAMHAQEVHSLTSSSAKLQEQIAKSEMLLHQANENATELKGKCHVLQHQVEALTTEREVWKGVEGRLTAENVSLTRERNNLSEILRNLQVMQSEIERNSGESRRRLENLVAKLEAQVRELKEKVKVEVDCSRQATLQRELESREYQSKLDKLTSEHMIARENLSGASAAKVHLEGQVGELQKQLAIKEERLAVYEGRRSGGQPNGSHSTFEAHPSLSKDQQLEIEISELKIELAAARDESARANEHVDQFKAIAESAEAALASLTATHDEYRTSQEAELERKQSALTALEEHLRKVTEDLSTATTQNSELHRQLESQRLEFEKEKLQLSNKLSELEDIETRVKAREGELRGEVSQHMKQVQDTHDRYQAEVQNHASSLLELKQVKDELVKARETIAEARSTAQTATSQLAASAASWSEQKATLQNEIISIQNRCDDLVKQNNLLHEHLETVSSQAAKISDQAIDSATGSGGAATNDEGGPNQMNENTVESLEQLRGVIRYLRNNYEIARQQIELSKLESSRLQQQLQHASKSLDQTRVELNHERERSREGYVSSVEHAQLLDQINTLNMVRESNVTLRDEASRSERKAKQLEERLKQTTSTLEPLRQELRELKLTVQQYQQEIAILSEDNERWKVRNQQILEKYDRIDPAEVQGLRDQIEELKVNLSQSQEEVIQIKHFKEKFHLLQIQARNARQKANDEKQGLEVNLKTVTLELEKFKEMVRRMEVEAKTSQSQTSVAAEQAAVQAQAQLEALRQEKIVVENNLAEAIVFKNQASEIQASLDALKVEFDESKASLATREAYFSRLLADNKSFIALNKQLSGELTKLKEEPAQQPVTGGQSEESIEAEVAKRLKEKLAAMPDKESTVAAPGGMAMSEEQVQGQLREANEKAIAEREAAVSKAIEETTQRLTAEFTASQAEAIEKLRAELGSVQNPGGIIPEDVVNAQVSSKVAEIKSGLEAAAAEKEKELVAKYEAELEEARKGRRADEPSDESKRLADEKQLEEKIRVAVEAAVKAREAELSETHKAALEAAIETTKSKVAAEMNSKANVIQMQLKKAHTQLAEYKKTQSSGPAPAPAPASPSTPLTATAAAFVPPAAAWASPPVSGAGPSSPAAAPSAGPPGPESKGSQVAAGTSGNSNAGQARGRGGPIVFGRGSNARGIRGGRGGLVGRGGAPGGAGGTEGGVNNGGQLPVEGRMTGRAQVAGGSGGSMVAIRGAASKRGGLGRGALLGAAVKALAGASGEPGGLGGGANVGGVPLGKRAREEEVGVSPNNGPGQTGDGNLKRVKGVTATTTTTTMGTTGNTTGSTGSTGLVGGNEEGNASELASRLSQRPS